MAGGGKSKVDLSELEVVGMRLSHPSSSKEILCNVLEEASMLLRAIQQLPQPDVLTAMKPSMDALVKPSLLKHKDKDVQFLVTSCISEIMRITAPDAPYDDDTLKAIFGLIVASFKGFNEKESRFFDKRIIILYTVASVRSCAVMLDLECDDLILEMFQSFFIVVSEEPKTVVPAMRAIMCLVLEESEEIPLPLMEVLLRNLLHGRKGVSTTASALARAVFKQCDAQLGPQIEKLLTSKSFKSRWRDSYHDLIFELSKLDLAYVFPLIPKLTEDLQTDKVEVRLKAIRVAGHMLEATPDSFDGLFMELHNLMFNKVLEIRLAAIEFAKHYLVAKPSRSRAQEVLDALCHRLQDHDVEVRRQVVAAICNFAKFNFNTIPIFSLKKVSECLLDTKPIVRRETFQQLIEVHREFCVKLSEGLVADLEAFCWIPSKLISCYADQEPTFLRAQAVEVVFAEQLFPVEFSIEKKVDCWIVSFATFDDKGLKIFENIFAQKQRLQQEMKNYLAYLSEIKEKESQKNKTELQEACKRLASFFVEPVKAELELQSLQSLSDRKSLEIIKNLMDVYTPSMECTGLKEDLLKLSEEDGLKHDFLRELAIKCSYDLFDKEHMKILLTKVKNYRSLGDERMLKASVGLMLVIARYFPGLLRGAETDLLELLKDERDFIKDGVVQILAETGGLIHMELPVENNSINLLEKYIVEGNRKQVKYAVQALAALCGDSGSDVWIKLNRTLLDALKGGKNLPTILKSLGIVAPYTNRGFKTQWEELLNFLLQDLLLRNSDSSDGDEQASATTNLKILCLKTVVRSFLHVREIECVEPPKEPFETLLIILKYGEISEKVISSNVDKAHLRLAAANAVFKLSRTLEYQISPKLFHAAISCAKDPTMFVKHSFVKNIYKGLMQRALPCEYSCAFALSIDDGEPGSLEAAKQQLGDYIKFARQVFSKGLVTSQPNYVLFYLVHTLAQEFQFPTLNGGLNIAAVEPVFRKLYLFIWALLLGDGGIAGIDACNEADLERIALIYGVFSAMKNAVDVVDGSKTENNHVLCDIGILIIKNLLGDAFTNLAPVDNIPLPEPLYKRVGENSMVGRLFLPSCLEDGEALSKLKSVLPFSVVVKQGKRKAESASLKDVKTLLHKQSKAMDNRIAGVQGSDSATLVFLKRKRGAHHGKENGEVSSPESVHEAKPSLESKNLKVSVDEMNNDVIPSLKVLSPDGSVTKRVRIFIKRPRPCPEEPLIMESINRDASLDMRKCSRKEVLDFVDGGGAMETSAQPVLSPRETPRRPSKLAAASSIVESPKAKVVEEEEAVAHELVGCRIRVWWPMDKKFYKGAIQAYYPSKKAHRVVYDDGDMEFLNLGNERWEILKDSRGTNEGSDRKKSSSQSKSRRSASKQGETELDDRSNRSDNTETREHGQEMADGEETFGSVSKRRKSAEKLGTKSISKRIDLKPDDSTHGESPTRTSRESGDIPFKALRSGKTKQH